MIIAVSGCPRFDGVSYTETTVASLFAAGASEVYVYDDVCWTGSGPACYALIQELARRFPGEDVLLLEDDVIACRNAIAAVERLQFTADCQAYSFFYRHYRICAEYPQGIDPDYCNWDTVNRNYRNIPPLAGIHLQSLTKQSFQYSQALKLSSTVVDFMASTPWPPIEILGVDDATLRYFTATNIRDHALGWYISHVSQYIGQVIPNWFEHIGDVSIAMHLANRDRLQRVKAGNWLGPDHDALTDDVSRTFVLS